MKKIIYGIIIIALTIGFSGCAGRVSNMSVAPAGKTIEAPQKGKAQIVFMRPATLGYMIQSAVFEMSNDKPLLVGIVAAKKKVTYAVEPGEHLFMVTGESADFMSAKLEAGKTYYALVSPRMGFWKARFSLKPIHADELDSTKFNSWLNSCQLVEISQDTEQWANENSNSIQAKYNEYYQNWMQKDISQRPILLPGDGK